MEMVISCWSDYHSMALPQCAQTLWYFIVSDIFKSQATLVEADRYEANRTIYDILCK